MALIRHIAGIPTATEQRCVRCCEVISTLEHEGACCWPGSEHLTGLVGFLGNKMIADCTPHDPHAIDDLREVLGEALAEMERAR